AKDAADKRRIERRLDRDAPAGLALALEISAPRPVIAPFTIRFLIDDSGARFDACSADSEAARDAILTAAITAGLTGEISCDLGLGTPSTRWGEAAVAGIEALAEVGGGTLTMSNADILVVGKEGTSQRTFDRAMGELEGALPPVFSLTAALPKEEVDEGNDSARPPEFVATRSPEGRVQLRGLLGDETTRAAVESYAAAAFGVNNVLPATRIDENVPQGWTARVLAALEGLSYMANGSATVTADEISISGQTGIRSARSDIARLLSSKLKDGAAFDLDVTYSEALDPLAALPTPEECVELINVAGNKRKITFAPSSSDIEADAMATIDAIADILRDCQTVQIEISGHTDSQGREVMNQQLSQARADAVLNAIMARRVLTSNLTARGYGEDQPIADNDTESGREANRRIEFQLVTPEDSEEDAEQSAEAAGDDDAEDNE
ncbi:MAG: OmpA family protein, partial [Silicimonas sp.]|nr:OmpA family protein [Silicimonas sp.]